MDGPEFVCLAIEGHWGFSQFFTSRNKAVINICVKNDRNICKHTWYGMLYLVADSSKTLRTSSRFAQLRAPVQHLKGLEKKTSRNGKYCGAQTSTKSALAYTLLLLPTLTLKWVLFTHYMLSIVQFVWARFLKRYSDMFLAAWRELRH